MPELRNSTIARIVNLKRLVLQSFLELSSSLVILCNANLVKLHHSLVLLSVEVSRRVIDGVYQVSELLLSVGVHDAMSATLIVSAS